MRIKPERFYVCVFAYRFRLERCSPFLLAGRVVKRVREPRGTFGWMNCACACARVAALWTRSRVSLRNRRGDTARVQLWRQSENSRGKDIFMSNLLLFSEEVMPGWFVCRRHRHICYSTKLNWSCSLLSLWWQQRGLYLAKIMKCFETPSKLPRGHASQTQLL